MKPLIVFDVGNVLLGFSLKKAESNWNKIEPGSGRAIARLLWKTRLGERFELGHFTGRGLHALIKRRTGIRMGYRPFRDAFNRIFTPIPANIRLLQRLSKRYPTALLSNTNAVHWRYMLSTYPELRAARWPYASQILRALKPHAAAYRGLAKRTGFPVRRFIYIDDRPDFIRAARRLGISAHRCVNRRSMAAPLRRAGLVF